MKPLDIVSRQGAASSRPGMYDERLVAPMRADLTQVGFAELTTPDEVDAALRGQQGSMLLMVNSVCGCAAGRARPGVKLALQQADAAHKPQQLTTVFAGQDAEATARARSYFAGLPPSSPQVALFRDGKLVYLMQRNQIEGREAPEIARELVEAFGKYFG